MATSTSSLGHTFTVDGLRQDISVDTRSNVIKRHDKILYREVLAPEATSIAFAAGQEITLANNLFIADRSISINANRERSEEPVITDANIFSVSTENILITDIFTTEQDTSEAIPLFLKHVFSIEKLAREVDGEDDLTISGSWKLLSAELLDDTFQPLDTTEFVLDTDQGILYNNLEFSFDTNANSYIFYYVKYSVREPNGKISIYTDLLSNENVFSLATIDDLTEFLTIIPGHKVYLIEETGGSFEVTLAPGSTYAYKVTQAARLQIITPANRDTTDPWFVKVTNGKFFTNIEGTLYKYHIAEFLTQSFDPEIPFKKVDLERSEILDKVLIKTDYTNVVQDTELELFVSILIDDKDDVGLAAYTTNTSLVGTIADNSVAYQKWSKASQIGIQSIDHRSGIIKLAGFQLKGTYQVYSSYYYAEEIGYEFTLVDFNPINNDSVLDYRTTLFIDPDTLVTSKSQTLYYLQSDRTGRVIESNWSAFVNTSGLYIDETPLYYEQYPGFLAPQPHHVFVDEFTVETSGIMEPFLILGDITVGPNSQAGELEVIDTRVRGGGILPDSEEEAKASNDEVEWYWDIGYWDGIPYPGNASYLVELPLTVLDGAGGVLTSEAVKDIVSRHTAAGIYPVVKAYGVDFTVSGVELTTSGIMLRWFSYGSY